MRAWVGGVNVHGLKGYYGALSVAVHVTLPESDPLNHWRSENPMGSYELVQLQHVIKKIFFVNRHRGGPQVQ